MSKRLLLPSLIILVLIVAAGLLTAEHYTSRPSSCGSCHIMKTYYDSWKRSSHGKEDIACVDCHYAPGEKRALKSRFKGLGQLFTYLASGDRAVRRAAIVSDLSCTTSECHPENEYIEKKIDFTETVPFTHKTHQDKTIEGQQLHCDTCHQHIQRDEHFQVPKVACFLCHFKNTDFNQGRAKCALCHEIPTKPLQKQKEEDSTDERPVTHQSLEEAGVPCESCHYGLVRGAGFIKKEDCFRCHDYSLDMVRKADDKKAMHSEHVAQQNADCFDCHSLIQHEEIEFLDPVLETCSLCHPDHHRYQKLLIVGEKRQDVMATPGLMYDVKTNCIGCHVEEREVKGELVRHASSKACIDCHTERYRTMPKEWKEKIGDEMSYAMELEEAAKKAIREAEGKTSSKQLERAVAMLEEGQENLRIVDHGGGVHNQKYAVSLLDAAMDNFEDAIELLKEK